MKRDLALALALPLLALGVQWLLWPWLFPAAWFFFYPAVFFSSQLAGFRSGVVSTVVSILLVWYFFLPPQVSFGLNEIGNLLAIFVFGAMGLLFSETHERLRRAKQSVEGRFEAIFDQSASVSKSSMAAFFCSTKNTAQFSAMAERSWKPNPSRRSPIRIISPRAPRNGNVCSTGDRRS